MLYYNDLLHRSAGLKNGEEVFGICLKIKCRNVKFVVTIQLINSKDVSKG